MATTETRPRRPPRPCEAVVAKKPKRKNAGRETGDPYASGFGARQAGAPLAGNPFDPGTRDFIQWADGWKAAADDKAIA